jgi:hypothetical protein
MVLTKVSDINVSNFSITKVNDNMYIRNGDEPVEIQSEWITLVKFPLPNLKFVKDIVASVPLSIPVDKDDNLYKFFKELSNFLSNSHGNQKLHEYIQTKEDKSFLKVKLYKTTKIFITGDTKPIEFKQMTDFYNYLTAGTRLRLIFTLGKQWKMAGEYGFPPVVLRIQIDGDHIRLPQKIDFVE